MGIIIFMNIALICVIVLFITNSKDQRRIRQLESDLKNMQEYIEEFRKRYNDNKKMPPKFPNDIYN